MRGKRHPAGSRLAAVVALLVVPLSACEDRTPDRGMPPEEAPREAPGPLPTPGETARPDEGERDPAGARDRGGEPADADEGIATARLREALDDLVRGPGEGEGADAEWSWFSAETAGTVRSVRVGPGGHAVVDFDDLRPLIPGASSSAGSEGLLRELDGAVFGVSGVRSVEYRMEGSCALFWEWLQYDCRVVSRPGPSP